MKKQVLINPKMRTLIIDWIIGVQMLLQLSDETLFLTVNLIDKVLCKVKVEVDKDKLQLIGLTCLFICSKFEEVDPPELNYFISASKPYFTKKQIIISEAEILGLIDYKIPLVNSLAFLERYWRISTDIQIYLLAKYIIEISLLDYSLICYSFSMIAASALVLACRLLGLEDDDDIEIVAKLSQHTHLDLLYCVEDLSSMKSRIQFDLVTKKKIRLYETGYSTGLRFNRKNEFF